MPKYGKNQPKLKAAENKKWEDLLAFHLATHDLPAKFQRNYIKAIPGRKLEIDFADLENKIAIEVQGGTWAKGKMGHNSGVGIQKDCIKSNLLQLNGWIILKFTSDQIKKLEAVDFVVMFYKTRQQA